MKKRLQAWGNSAIIPIVSCFVFNQDGRLLLLQRHSQDLGGGQWGTPGGRVETGEKLIEAVLRELREETGVRLSGLKLLGSHEVRMPHGTVHMTSFKASVPNAIKIVIDPEEHHDYRWLELQDLLVTDGILWGVPTALRDFGLHEHFESDPTLSDGSKVLLLDLAK